MTIKTFVFSPFQVNTYILFDETKECIIVDPGCHEEEEQTEIIQFIDSLELKPVYLINTHPHIDHILGNNFIFRKFGLRPRLHKAGISFIKRAPEYARMFGINLEQQVLPEDFIEDGDFIFFGNSKLEARYTPGHVDGSICLVCESDEFVLTGDVLFYESVGRTDLPSGNFGTLMQSIKMKLLSLPDNYYVYSGHGHETTIGHERRYNPFIAE